MRTIGIIAVTVLVTAIITSVAWYWYMNSNPKIVVRKVTVHETKYIKVARTYDELKKCYDSKLNIQVTTRDNKVYVTAFDECKSADAEAVVTVARDIEQDALIAATGMIIGVLFAFLIL